MFRRIAAALLVLCLTACVSWQPVGPTPAQYLSTEHPSTVRVTLANGERVTIIDPVIAGDSVAGRLPPSAAATGPAQRVAFPLADVTEMTTSHVNAGRTIVLIGLSALTVAAIVEIANGIKVFDGSGPAY